MKIGNLVTYNKENRDIGYVLHCGTGIYEMAVVISVEPFKITSLDSNMLWNNLDVADMEVVGTLDDDSGVLNRCKRRLEN